MMHDEFGCRPYMCCVATVNMHACMSMCCMPGMYHTDMLELSMD